LDLNCTAGLKVGVTLTDATNPSNTSTTLNLSPDSTATGVGLQILKGSTPIAYGADSPAANNLNQWSAGTLRGRTDEHSTHRARCRINRRCKPIGYDKGGTMEGWLLPSCRLLPV
jgi:hypothetical protein